MEWISASEASKFQSTVNGFIDEVTGLGSLTLNTRATKETDKLRLLKEFLLPVDYQLGGELRHCKPYQKVTSL